MITYPVDVANTRWAVWEISTSTILRRRRRWPRQDGQALVNANPDLVMLLEVQTTPPVVDPNTHTTVHSAPIVDVNANTLTQTWAIVGLGEDALEEVAIMALLPGLKNSVGTNIVRINRLEKVGTFMLERY